MRADLAWLKTKQTVFAPALFFFRGKRTITVTAMPKSHDGSQDLFGAEASRYSSSRPSYPPELVDNFISSVPKEFRKWALDVAAGSGQLSVLLAEQFDQVVALDKSEEQLKHAHARPNISYCAGTAYNLPRANEGAPLSNGMFDVVTCAQAYHWFIAEKSDKIFLEEATRVLNPDHGRLGVFGYGVCSIASSPRLESIFKDFYYNDLESALPPSSPNCHWNIDRRLLDSSFEGMSTHGVMEIVEKRHHIQTRKMTTHAFLNYIRTFSALSSLRQSCATRGEIDPVEKLYKAFEAHSEEDEILEVNFLFFLIILRPHQ